MFAWLRDKLFPEPPHVECPRCGRKYPNDAEYEFHFYQEHAERRFNADK